MMTTETKPYDAALFIKTDDDIVNYLNDAFLDDDPNVFIIALGDVAKIKGMAELARQTGLNRESLYRALSGNAKPQWDTVQRVLKALNINIRAVA